MMQISAASSVPLKNQTRVTLAASEVTESNAWRRSAIRGLRITLVFIALIFKSTPLLHAFSSCSISSISPALFAMGTLLSMKCN